MNQSKLVSCVVLRTSLVIMNLLFFCIAAVIGSDPSEIDSGDYSHIVVIPDVHGDKEAFLRSLWLAQAKIEPGSRRDFAAFSSAFTEAIKDVNRPGKPLDTLRDNVMLVQMGDLVDRGPFGEECVKIMQVVPAVLGWHTKQLIGNHELLNVPGSRRGETGDLFITGSPLRAELNSKFLVSAKLSGFVNAGTITQETNPNTLFVHAGMNVEWLEKYGWALNDLNRIIQTALAGDDSNTLSAFHKQRARGSPVWMREFAIPYASGDRVKGTVDEELCLPGLDALLKQLGVVRIVVGHMPIEDRVVKSRCGGKLFLTDVKLSRWMGAGTSAEAKPTALVFEMALGGTLKSIVAYYSDIHGQHQTQTVLSSAVQPPVKRSMKDRFMKMVKGLWSWIH